MYVARSKKLGRCKLYLIIKIMLVNNQVLRKIKIAVKSDVKNWAYISLR